MLEIARTITALVNSKKIALPQRTIRFMWVPETLGTVAYVSNHPELSSKLVAGINLDMVGQNQELCRSSLCLDRTPDSLPSYLNDYVFRLIEQTVKEFDVQTSLGSASTFRYRAQAFSGGSDHAEFNEVTIKVPCVMLLQWPDLFYHTSMDTIDNVSEDSLKRIGWIATMAALTLANADVEDAFLLAYQTASKGMTRIAEACNNAAQALFQIDSEKELYKAISYFKSKIEHIIWREQEAVKSVKKLAKTSQLDRYIDVYCRDIEALGKQEAARLEDIISFIRESRNMKTPKFAETRIDEKARRLIPKRLFKGTLNSDLLRQKLTESEYEWYEKIGNEDKEFGKKMAEIINFIDGKRTAYEIVNAVSAEYSQTNTEHALKFLKDLGKLGLVIFQ